MSDKHYDALPKAHTTYANIVKSLLPIGNGGKVSRDQLPQSTYYVDDLHIDQENLDDYRKICGFADDGKVPATYFSVLSQTLQMNMMVKEPFPFAMLGLVHVDNSVTQYRPIGERETVAMSVTFDNLRDHAQGQQFDFVTIVKSEDEVIWEGTSTYLSRSKKPSSKDKKSAPRPVMVKPEVNEEGVHSIFEVPEDIGRRYAFVSGDFNLIHLHPLSARAFGFPKAIAHGMWSKAKCLALMGDLPDAYTTDVSFKLPIFLPAEVELIAEPVAQLKNVDDTCEFGLYSSKNNKPHLAGVVTLKSDSK
ncbi:MULTISPECIES: MaoC/PaaZ C-terminal domain-containing protein [unclassified Psychrobacter]|uniref:MaoC family dehydratase n=1 Tax=unclassified Psychrobacter TaxID=196806 RepID=UPI00086C8A5F|nr:MULTISPECIES: MaoC/PaaZ C-terminal domain-containing protein [unclassified Psychrobacter]OEH69034.1 MAG: acyl dehydratase [Psychrobacter sp. B29-1]PKG67834.1 acyl dehydratase [Psychrobacter sp. Choline-02u-13]PKH54715.1 acyl dehydratase [Psychrobacter sp. Choline-02u-9]|tara:strand:+ start:115166 stop:116080 length:915 start_codon:yes stop_codon:yes gene_type:complete